MTIVLAGLDPDAADERARIARADYLLLLALGVAPSRAELILGSGHPSGWRGDDRAFAQPCEAFPMAAAPYGNGDAKAGNSAASPTKDDGAKAAPKEHKPGEDVVLTKCSADDPGMFPQAELAVTNQSSRTSNYIVQVAFTGEAGTRKGEDTAALNNLGPMEKAQEKAVGLTKVPAGLKCKITDVTRYASNRPRPPRRGGPRWPVPDLRGRRVHGPTRGGAASAAGGALPGDVRG
ncbi:hypothetical protein [Streptomyces sp. NPDC004675]|uniref:hypothetical protein n=1 Tax=Streptomyces sp. NPDC004675 TaxID=3154286 RepID=UPI0033B238FA